MTSAPPQTLKVRTFKTGPYEPFHKMRLPIDTSSHEAPTLLIFSAFFKMRSLTFTCAKHTLVKVRKSKCLTRARTMMAPLTLSLDPQLSRARARGRAGGRLCYLCHSRAKDQARACRICRLCSLMARLMAIDRRSEKW